MTVDYQVRNPDYEARVRESFRRQVLMHTIGAELIRVAPGEVEIKLPFRDDLTQQHGFVHAGIIATIADSACGYAAFTLMPTDAAVLSIEYKINLLAPAIGEYLLARAEVLRPGRTVTTCTGHVFAVRDGSERRVATMLATMMTVQGREGLEG